MPKRSRPPRSSRELKESFRLLNRHTPSPKLSNAHRLRKASCSSSIFPAAATKTPTFIAKIFRSSMPPTRIQNLFNGRKALIAYLTAGDPSPDHTPGLVAALERGGADLIELGVPFSDPIADGPVIQRGSDRALRAGTTLNGVLGIAARIRERSTIPLLLFTYMNPVLRYGLEKLAHAAAACGVDGCLLTDLSVE